MNWFFLIAFILILGALAAAGLFMIKRPRDGQSPPRRMAWALALRVGASIALFLFILLAWHLGWIQPHGLVR